MTGVGVCRSSSESSDTRFVGMAWPCCPWVDGEVGGVWAATLLSGSTELRNPGSSPGSGDEDIPLAASLPSSSSSLFVSWFATSLYMRTLAMSVTTTRGYYMNGRLPLKCRSQKSRLYRPTQLEQHLWTTKDQHCSNLSQTAVAYPSNIFPNTTQLRNGKMRAGSAHILHTLRAARACPMTLTIAA